MKKNLIIAFLIGSIITGFGQYIFDTTVKFKPIDWKAYEVFSSLDNGTNMITILGSGKIIYRDKEAQKLFQEFVASIQKSYKDQYIEFPVTR